MLIKTFKEAIPYLQKSNIATLVWGPHGIGKSQVVKQYCDENKLGFIDLRLGTQEVGDLLGLADFVRDEKGQSVATRFMQPTWFPTDPDSKGMIFLDEINRGRRDVLQAVFQLVLDRKLHTYSLPKGWYVIAAANPNTDDYIVLDLGDKAFMDRFCHIKLTPSVSEWIDYAGNIGLDESIIEFIRLQPDLLQVASEEFSFEEITPSRRSWEALSRLTKAKTPLNILQELGFGIVGMPATMAYIDSLSSLEKPFTAEDILNDYPKHATKIKKYSDPLDNRYDLLKHTADNLNQYFNKRKKDKPLTDAESKNLTDYMMAIPLDQAFNLYRELFLSGELARNVLQNCKEIKDRIAKKKDK